MWIDVLAELVTSHWSSTGKALLLSKVKFELERKGVELSEALEGRKLKDAILEDGQTKVRLTRNPERPLVWGVLPNNVKSPGELASLFGAPEAKASSASTRPRFGRGVWLAFAKPIRPGTRRYLEIGPPSRFADVPDGGIPSAEGVEVEQEFIYNTSGALVPIEDHEHEVEANIRKWAEAKEIAIERLTVDQGGKLDRSAHYHHRGNQFDLLDLSALSPADKARISIPLDLLPKIRFGRRS